MPSLLTPSGSRPASPDSDKSKPLFPQMTEEHLRKLNAASPEDLRALLERLALLQRVIL
jgi:hypothetical protein